MKNGKGKIAGHYWIGQGIRELQSPAEIGIRELQPDEIGFLGLQPDEIVLPQKRHEELIQKEKTLDILCRLIVADKSYRFDLYQAVAGEYFPIEKEEKKDEFKPQ